ncbi:MAG: hypothetical protein JO368_01750 [Acidimicrobiales bacterium]|nr:hypothetical protein [Acidimicrobiales bacterium]
MPRTTATLQLSIEVDSDPISGSLANGAHGPQPFNGWIELVAAIEAARISGQPGADSGQPREKTLGSLPGAKATEL